MPKTTQKRLEWERNAWRYFSFKLSKTRDKKEIEYLESKPSINAFVKELIVDNMQKQENK